jgi:hypothetical protein
MKYNFCVNDYMVSLLKEENMPELIERFDFKRNYIDKAMEKVPDNNKKLFKKQLGKPSEVQRKDAEVKYYINEIMEKLKVTGLEKKLETNWVSQFKWVAGKVNGLETETLHKTAEEILKSLQTSLRQSKDIRTVVPLKELYLMHVLNIKDLSDQPKLRKIEEIIPEPQNLPPPRFS